jgi:hypothetical protein
VPRGLEHAASRAKLRHWPCLSAPDGLLSWTCLLPAGNPRGGADPFMLTSHTLRAGATFRLRAARLNSRAFPLVFAASCFPHGNSRWHLSTSRPRPAHEMCPEAANVGLYPRGCLRLARSAVRLSRLIILPPDFASSCIELLFPFRATPLALM